MQVDCMLSPHLPNYYNRYSNVHRQGRGQTHLLSGESVSSRLIAVFINFVKSGVLQRRAAFLTYIVYERTNVCIRVKAVSMTEN